ncbi:bifunctional PIG-L family deacetylase/class I SAM-dependent methyltransferase [Pseudonocardia parietis]|uniref:SAM-dependent methyltransferase n=1 Tax=Pseudonocardia parietis TaxID=570936 RepID=A0ABS4VVG4_9PSEU|nr:bifunctional PIG-L family deacetylase/class I SAM-dependent methyltransferase [Pseudonocardia parietis]MBP2367896.1 SAM-dependent methyltransferase [Pseudonocardia parietis]
MRARPCTDVWEDAADALAVRELDPTTFRRLVVVAAHPGDGVLGAAGLLRAVAAAGGTVELVLTGDGEAALPEVRALDALGVTAAVHRLGLPGPALDEDALTAALAPLLEHADAWACPWRDDPHPDHAAVGRACRTAAPVTTHGFDFPLRARARLDPTDPSVPWDRGYRLLLSGADHTARDRAVGHAHCATTPDHLHGSREIYFRDPPAHSTPAGVFAARYRGGADPWQVRTSWYERRKRDVVLAALPREHYRLVAEPGCGPGELTRALAGRCRRLVASDVVDEAVAATAAATATTPWVEVHRSDVDSAAAFPDGADLVVLSEVLCYLTPARIDAVLDRVAAAVRPGGDVVLVHGRQWPAEAPADARAVHRRACDGDRFTTLVEHLDDEFLLHVVRRR